MMEGGGAHFAPDLMNITLSWGGPREWEGLRGGWGSPMNNCFLQAKSQVPLSSKSLSRSSKVILTTIATMCLASRQMPL